MQVLELNERQKLKELKVLVTDVYILCQQDKQYVQNSFNTQNKKRKKEMAIRFCDF